MDDSKCVPQDDILVIKATIRVGSDPSWDALRWLARSLRDVAAGRMDLFIVICMHESVLLQ